MSIAQPPPGQWQPAPLPLAPNGLPLADFGNRLLAFLIDSAIFAVVYMIITLPLMLGWIALVISQAEQMETGDDMVNPFLLFGFWFIMFFAIMAVVLLFSYLYRVEYQLRQGGQTVGKKVMKLRVIPVDPQATLTRQQLIKRWAVQDAAGIVVPFFNYVDGFWQLWDKPLQQCLHDKAAQTVVVRLG